MAKAPSNPFQQKLDELDAQIADQEKAIEAAKQAYLKDPSDAASRAALQDAKAPLMALSVERGFYVRALSEMAGGKNHTLPAT